MLRLPGFRAVGSIWMVLVFLFATCVSPAFGQGKPPRKPPAKSASPIAAPAVAGDPTSLSRYLPSDELFFLELENTQPLFDAADAILKSEEIRKIIADDPKHPLATAAQYEQFLTMLGLPDKATLGQLRAAVAVRFKFPKPDPKVMPQFKEPEPEVAALIEAPSAEAAQKLLSALERIAYQQGNVPKGKPVPVGKYKMITYASPRPVESTAYLQADKLLIFGHLSAVKSLAGTINRPSPARLGTAADFNVVREKLGTPRNLLAYVNVRAIGDLMLEGYRIFQKTSAPSRPKGPKGGPKIPPPPAPKKASAEDAALANIGNYLGLPSVGGFGLSFGKSEKSLIERVFFAVDRKGKGLFPILADAPNVTLRGADVVPASSHVFMTFGFNHLRLFDEVMEALRALPTEKGQPTPDQGLAAVESEIGLKLRDELLVGFTGEQGLAIDPGTDLLTLFENIQKDKFPDTAHLVGYAVLKDPALVKKAAEKFIAKAVEKTKSEGVQVEPEKMPVKETYKDTEWWRLENGGFAFLDDVVVFGRAADIKWVIDARMSGDTLSRSDEFKKGMQNFPRNSMQSVYMSGTLMKRVIDTTKQVAPPEAHAFLDSLPSRSIVSHLQHDDTGVYGEFNLDSSIGMVGVIQAIAIPNLLAARRSANQASAMSTMRLIYQAQVKYSQGKGDGNFTDNLDNLAGDLDGTITQMQTVPKSGYLLGPISVTPASGGTPAKFTMTCFPVEKNGATRTGGDCYFIDETGVLRHSGSANVPADAASPPVGD